jgi:carbonic anhydrase
MRRPCIFPAVGRQLLVQGSATSPSSALLLRGDVLRSRSLARPGSVRHLRASSSPSVFPTTASATAEEDVQPQTSGMILDLGLPSLVPEWCRMFRSETVLADVAAGLTVGCIAVPLSLAIAVASGLPPEVGLVSAATAGLVGSLMGGTTLAITGPANAIILLIGEAVHTHGIAALPMITCAAGALQLLTGVARGGRVTKYVPWNVISGFTTGIGLMILTGQLPKALGLAVPGGLKPFEIVAAMGERITDVNFGAAALAMGTAAAMLSLPKLHPKIPSALVAVAGATAATRIFDLDVATVGALPSAVDAFQLSALTLPPVEALPSLGSTILLIYAMISIESLLSCSAIDKMRPTPYKHCADQELIGQGLANMTSSAFMGMPVTAVIARSSLNVKLKGSTRLPGLVQAGFVFSSMAFFSDTVATVPIASLSGVLITSCISMLPPPEIKHCLAVDRWADSFRLEGLEGMALGCARYTSPLLFNVAQLHAPPPPLPSPAGATSFRTWPPPPAC